MFWVYLAALMAKETNFDVHMWPETNVNVDAWEGLSYGNYTLNEPSTKLPVGAFESPPCFGKRPCTFSIEVHASSTISIVINQVSSMRASRSVCVSVRKCV